jgi:hypothetical protein
MRVARSNECVARLKPGDAKRIPEATAKPLVGYYLACPSCGRVQALLASHFLEAADGLTMTAPVPCTRDSCLKRFTIHSDEFQVIP